MGFLTLIRLVSQFGVRRVLFLRGYLKGIIGSVFQSGSLRNVDLDEDGKVDGFAFRLKNPVSSGYYKGFELDVDGEEIPVQDIEIKVNDQTLRGSQVTFGTPICFLPGQPSEVTVHKPGGLTPGKHRIRLTLQLRNASSLYLRGEVEFRLGS